MMGEVLKACEREAMLRGALETCAKTFRRYGEMHRAKGTTEGNLKASNNDDLAEFCESVLTDTRTPAVATDEGVVRDALLAEIERQTDGDWPINTNEDDDPVWLVDGVIDFDELARAAISAMAHRP
jgi:hypothetical protein